MQGSGGPVSAGTISSQAGLGSPAAPYTGIPGYTDKPFNPFDPMNSQGPVSAATVGYGDQDEAQRRQDRRFSRGGYTEDEY